MPKKKQTKTQRHDARIRKARQWVLTYQGSHIVRAYRKRFGVDTTCALKDLGEIGALSPEKLAVMQRAEQLRLERKRREREEKELQAFYDRFPNSNDYFYYIAGYTPGGAPYGITWEEMGLSPWELPDDDF